MIITERISEVLEAHQRDDSDGEGWVDCTCGWKANRAYRPTDDELAQLNDPDLPDPADHTGDPDPDHVGNDGPYCEHRSAMVAEMMEE